MMEGSRVKMLRPDGWGKKGWTGTARDVGDGNVRVSWDNGRSYIHQIRDVIIIDENNPNSIFQIHKLKKKGFKV